MAIISDALRQAFMPKHEYESLRDEEKAWGRLQRPLVVIFVAALCLAAVAATVISLNIVFPAEDGKRPFCRDLQLQPLTVSAGGRDPDIFPGAFYLTEQEAADYFWMVVFIPSSIVFLVSIVYLFAGEGVGFSGSVSTLFLLIE